MKKFTVIGHFAFGLEYLDGQTVKTKIVAEELCRRLGEAQVAKTDTHGGIKSFIKAPFQLLHALKKSENIVILPAQNGLRVYAPLLSFFKRFFKNRKLHYAVIGGWLPSFLENRKRLVKSLKRFDYIYAETNCMKKSLQNMGFDNVFVMPNCKKLDAVDKSSLNFQHTKPYKLCTFSRVMREKGIEDAVTAVETVNAFFGETLFTLDIYGPVDPSQTEWFAALHKSFSDSVKYMGSVAFDKSVDTLKGYFALLFPTRFYTEGVPGTVIDAYAAGLPVVSAKWENFCDVVDDGGTGIGYGFGDVNALCDVLKQITENPQLIEGMRLSCVEKAKSFSPEAVIDILIPKEK